MAHKTTPAPAPPKRRNTTLALACFAAAAGIKVRIVPGSESDAKALLKRDSLRVTYLDLRRATVAQALNWLLTPFRMNWRVTDGGRVIVETARRSPGLSPWVYDVSAIALPTQEELGKDYQKAMKNAKQAADGFLKVVRGVLGQKKESGLFPGSAVWFGPGELLIYGDAGVHERAARLFAALGDPKASVAELGGNDLLALQKVAATRLADRKEAMEKAAPARRSYRVARALNDFSWRLLGEASARSLDLEALTELQIAWMDQAVSELPGREWSLLVSRSLWTITEAARLLPDNKELSQLAQAAWERSETLRKEALDEPADARKLLAAVYLTLAAGNVEALKLDAAPEAASFVEMAAAASLDKPDDDTARAAVRTLAGALFRPRQRIPRKDLIKLIESSATEIQRQLAGDDFTTLCALASKRAGGEVWRAFRANARDFLGRQALHGSVVVLVNRLEAVELPGTARR